MRWRSYLFVPGDRPERFDKARATHAHAVIVDLEDAVPHDRKRAARDAFADWLSEDHPVLVRVNARTTEWFEDDLAACAHPGVSAVVLPKTERAADVDAVVAACGARMPVFPLIESAAGLWNALEVGRASNVQALMFGSLDYQADLGTTDDELLLARSQLVLVSRVAGIAAPIDGVTVSIGDEEALRRDALRARGLGFAGKLCIHPRQVDVVNACFLPTAAQIAWARRIVDGHARAGGGVVTIDGGMVDRPVLLKAQAIIAEADGTR
ncbi:MAG: CoA ester lyase [Casimicrobiaceae bacterium]